MRWGANAATGRRSCPHARGWSPTSQVVPCTVTPWSPARGTTWEMGLDPRAWWQLRRTVTAFAPDIIHVHDSHALTLAATVARGRRLVPTRLVDFHVRRFNA